MSRKTAHVQVHLSLLNYAPVQATSKAARASPDVYGMDLWSQRLFSCCFACFLYCFLFWVESKHRYRHHFGLLSSLNTEYFSLAVP